MKENMATSAGDFTQGSIPKKLIKFMFPILGALILQAMYGAVDMLIIGWFGSDEAISAVSTGSNIVNMITFTITGLAMGVTVIMGRYIGEKREDRLGDVIGGAICFFFILSVAVAGIMLLLARPISILMQAPAEALDLTVQYVRICGGGLFFIVAYNLISGIFRGIGNSRLPLIFVAIACVTNVFGDLLFVAVFHMNVAGAALATVIAQAVSVVLSLVIIRKQPLPFTLKKENIRFNKEVPIFLKLGAPIALQEFLTQISFLALCAFVNKLGLDASSGYGVANKLVSFIMLIPSALMQSMSSFVAQNVGAGKEKRATQAMLTGMVIGVVIGSAIASFAIFKGDLLARIFTDNDAYIARAFEYLKGNAPEAIVTGILFSFIGYFNGHGKTLFVMIQGLLQTFLVRLPMSYIMSIQPNASLTNIGLAAPTATIFGIILNLVYFIILRKKMKENLK
jgi:putative MATE family efflux protein